MELTLNIANSVIRVPVGDTGQVTEVDLASIPANVHAIALVNGYIGALNNIARSNGKGEEPKTDKQWAKARADKVEVWKAGEWAATGGGSRDVLPFWDAYFAEKGAGTEADRKKVRKAAAELVEKVFGKDTSCTFVNFLQAVATELPGDTEETFGKLEAKYTKLALKLVQERKQASAAVKIDLKAMLA